MDHVERRTGTHDAAPRAAHRPPARPLRGGVAQPAPLKVYCVEPRDFRELVQRLTGAGTTAAPAQPMTRVTTHAPTAVSQSDGRVEAAGQFDYSPWLSAPLFSPAYAPAGFDNGRQGRFCD